MRILLLALLSGHDARLLRAFDARFTAMRDLNPDTHAVVLSPESPPKEHPYAFLWKGDLSRAQQFQAAANIARRLQADRILFRYPLFDGLCYGYVQRCPNTVFEHYCLPRAGMNREEREKERYWAERILRECAGVVAPVPSLLAYAQARSGINLPGLCLPGGTDLDALPLLERPPFDEELHIGSAAFTPSRHGVDRLLAGMAAFPGKARVHLHLTGEESGGRKSSLRRRIDALGLRTRVHLHGPLEPEALQDLLGGCHLAAGCLSPSNAGLGETASLCHRDYAALGLPFVFGGADPDFPADYPYSLTLPDDDSPVDVAELWDFARLTAGPDAGRAMRAHAGERLSWRVKTPQLLDFLRTSEPPGVGETMEAAPRLSFIVYCRNGAPLLDRCLYSIVRQELEGLEVILVRSSGASALEAHVRETQRSFPTLSARHALADADTQARVRAAGFAQARGEWLFFLDSSDVLPDGLARSFLEAAGTHPQADMVAGQFEYEAEGGNPFAAEGLLALLRKRRSLVRPLFIHRRAWNKAYGVMPHAPWRKGDNAFRRYCRRCGLVPLVFEHCFLRRHRPGFLRRLRLGKVPVL